MEDDRYVLEGVVKKNLLIIFLWVVISTTIFGIFFSASWEFQQLTLMTFGSVFYNLLDAYVQEGYQVLSSG